jgi:hypothetical protein
MFSHVVVGTNGLERARTLYDAVPGSLVHGQASNSESGRRLYAADPAFFMVTAPLDGRPATSANGGTIGCTGRSH